MANNIKLEEGRIRYIEPNYTGSLEMVSEEGIQQYERILPMEDYSIYVNLEVEVRGRTIRVNGGSEMKTYIMTWESDQKGSSVNFMGGSKIPIGKNGAEGYINSLTTNYTNTFISDVTKETNDRYVDEPSIEMFGISSIDISYNNYMVPEVTINFVDVRGISLFAQEEYRHNKENGYSDETIAGSFFKCFFTFPYPKFTLMVKGFYGEPVSYELTCSDFRARFDSNTGNFGATAKFVGYAFSFFGDISLRSILAAPYSDYLGKEYWNAKVQSGEFFIYDDNDQKISMPLLGDVLNDVPEAVAGAEHLAQNSPEVQQKTSLEDKTAKLTQIQNLYTSYSDTVKTFLKDVRFEKIPNNVEFPALISVTDLKSDQDIIAFGLLVSTNADKSTTFAEYVGDNGGVINNAYERLKTAIEEYNSTYNSYVPLPWNIALNTPMIALGISDKDGIYVPEVTRQSLITYEDESVNRHDLYNAITEYVNNNQGKKVENRTVDGVKKTKLYAYVFLDSTPGILPFHKFIARESQCNADDMSKAVSAIDEAVDRSITFALGYPPTVENITRILLAHFETFAYMVFKTGESICSDMGSRKLEALGISQDCIPDVVSPVGSVDFVPPFPKVVHTRNEYGESVTEETWVGNYKGDFLEKDLINGLINGTNEFAEHQKTDTAGGATANDRNLTKTMMALPIMPFDFVATAATYAPYEASNNNNELAARLAMRAFGLFGISNVLDDDYEKIGRLEAINFYMANQSPIGSLIAVTGDTNISQVLYNTVCMTRKTDEPERLWGNEPFLVTSSKSNRLTLKKNTIINTKDGVSEVNTAIALQNIFSTKDNGLVNSNHFNSGVYDKNSDYFTTNANEYKVCTNLYRVESNPMRINAIIQDKFSVDDDDIKDLATYYEKAIINDDNIEDCIESFDRFLGDFEDLSQLTPVKNSRFFPATDAIPCNNGVFSNVTDDFVEEEEYSGAKRLPVDKDSFYMSLDASKLTLTSFYGVELSPIDSSNIYNSQNATVNEEVSLFGQDLYYQTYTRQDDPNADICMKAYLFLSSLGGIYDYEDIFEEKLFNIDDGEFDNETMITLVPYVSVLMAGAIIWKNKLYNNFKQDEIQKQFDLMDSNDIAQLLFNLRVDFRRQLSNDFVEWAVNVYKPRIHDSLSIAASLDDFNKLIEPRESDKKNTIPNFYVDDDKQTVFERFRSNCRSSFFGNYLSVGKNCVRDNSKGVFGMRLLNRPNGEGIIQAMKIITSYCTFIKTCKYSNGHGSISLSKTAYQSFLEGFTSKLKELYVESTKQNDTSNQIDRAKDPEGNTTNDIRISLYRYCKLLYDKWVGGMSSYDFQREWTVKRFFGDDMENERYFYFIDNYYSSSRDIFINVGEMCEMIQNSWTNNDYTLLSFISDLYARNKFQFFCIQNFLDLSNKTYLEKMFDPVPVNEMTMPNKIPNFIVMFASEPSSSLDVNDRHDFRNDSFLVSKSNNDGNNKWPTPLLSRNAGYQNGYDIPAFGVSYGKMYQSYFKNIEVGMDNPIVTEQSLKAQYSIASMHNESGDSNPRSATLMGQDLFTVYSNNSYTCKVDMMGCAWIQPLMYFVLNNVPLFRGTYLIEKVQHHLEPGYMSTNFIGVRMSNIRTRKNSTWLQRKKADRVGGQTTDLGPSAQELAANINNNCPYRAYPILTNTSYNQDNYANELNGTVGQYNNGSDWGKMSKNYNLLDALTAVGIVEAGGVKNDTALKAVAAVMYNHRAHLGWAKGPLRSGNFSARNTDAAVTNYNNIKNGQSDYTAAREIFKSVFTNGSASIAGLSYKMSWNVDLWGNNTLGKKTGQSYTLTPEEAAGMYFFCFKQEWEGTFPKESTYKQKGDKATQMCTFPQHTLLCSMSKTESQLQYYCAQPNAWEKEKQKMKQKPPVALNDNSNKISDFAMGFYNAVQQTSNNSDVHVEFGVSEEKSNGLNIYFTNGRKATNFSGIFDIVLNTSEYFDHVKQLKWISDSNSLKKEPSGILVELSEASVSSHKVGISIDDGKTLAGNTIQYKQVNSGFCTSVVKKYATADIAKNSVFGISDLPDMFNNQTIIECASIVSEGNNGMSVDDMPTGFEGKVTNPRMKKVLENCDLLCHAHNYKTQSEWYTVRGTKNKKYKPSHHGWCTYGPSTWYNFAGIDLTFGGEPKVRTYRSETTQGIKKHGFKLVWHGTVEDALKLPKEKFRPGDIATEYYTRTDGVDSGHACMWTGSDWRSDFVQATIMASRNFKGREGGYSVCIWRHPDFQEPGLEVNEVS